MADTRMSWEVYADNYNVNPNQEGMARAVIRRHGAASVASTNWVSNATRPLPGKVNVSLADGHVEPCKLDDLWLYYWNVNSQPVSRP